MRYIYIYEVNSGYILQKEIYTGTVYKTFCDFFKNRADRDVLLSDEDYDINSVNLRYFIKDGQFREFSDDEVLEVKKYGYVLSADERERENREKLEEERKEKEFLFLQKIQPTKDEILKAEIKLEILNDLIECGVIKNE